MRLARLGDYRRRVRTKGFDWALKLQRFAFEDVPSLGTAEISLTSPFLILSGPNGVGKTTVLRALWAAADPKSARPSPGTLLKLTTGSATLDYTWYDEAFSSSVNFSGGNATGGATMPTSVIHLDASSEPLRYQHNFCGFHSAEDVINGFGGSTIENNTLVELNYICKRDYRSITIYEVEDGDKTVPFFEVQFGNDRYDSRTMGSGEISALHTWWVINRAPENSLLLIEEPETFLSPASQQGLSHFLLASTVEKHLVTFVTSHSAKIVDSVADEHRLFLFRDGSGSKFAHTPVSSRLLATIGIEPVVNIILLVEDEGAALFLAQILEFFDTTFARSCEICDKKGDGNIIKTLRETGGQFRAVRVVGVFDGDLRGSIPAEISQYAAFLPGDLPIEKMLRDFISLDTEGVAEALSKPRLAEVLFSLQGADHHDWYHELCAGIGLTKAQLFPMLFGLWIKQPANESAAAAVINAIRSALYGSSGGAPREGGE